MTERRRAGSVQAESQVFMSGLVIKTRAISGENPATGAAAVDLCP